MKTLRELFKLYSPSEEIGALFDKTDNWACVTYHRARMMLKSRLEEQDETK